MIRGAVTFLLLFGNVVLWGTPILIGGVVKLLMPTFESRRRLKLLLAELGDRWAGGNDRIFRLMLPVRWDVDPLPDLRRDGHYLILSNHISWADVFVLFHVFHRRAPFIRFFLKRELIWVPIVGVGCWALEFPFMRRYTADDLARHPEKRGKDLATTYRACRRYRRIPVAILNFLEGTRFTRDKQADQDSPYRHLLRPRVGGAAFTLAVLGDLLDEVLDVTIAYPGHEISLWDFLCGRIDVVRVRVRSLGVPPEFFTSAITEPGHEREQFKAWIEKVWREKDEWLSGPSVLGPRPSENDALVINGVGGGSEGRGPNAEGRHTKFFVDVTKPFV